VQQVRVVLRAAALLQLDKGTSPPRIASMIPLTPQAIRKIGHRYQNGGLEAALCDKQRPGGAPVLADSQKHRIIAMVCSDPPEGRRAGIDSRSASHGPTGVGSIKRK
jgi:transposase